MPTFLTKVFAHRRSCVVVALFSTVVTVSPAQNQEQTAEAPRLGMPYDWSHHYVIFSNAGSAKNMAAARQDPRFWQQKIRMESPVNKAEFVPVTKIRVPKRVDWSVNLGGTGSAIAPGMYPAKYSFDVNAAPSCANDFVVFGLNVAGSSSQATIVAYNKLYTASDGTGFCIGTGPTVKWAYNTGGAINTSPTLSLDGKKVAWVSSANPPVLHVLTIGTTGSNGSSVTSPAVAGTGNNAVDTAVSFGSVGDTRSSAFVDYRNDAAYVGSDDGVMHKFTGIFLGTPTHVVTGGWPLQILSGANHKITGPIFDSVSKNLYYTDDSGIFTYIREVGSTVGTCIVQPSPPCWGQVTFAAGSSSNPVIDAPIVDSALQKVYVFIGNDGQLPTHARVLQTDTALGTSAEPQLGIPGMGMYHGYFDNKYFTNLSSGFLYVCGYPTLLPIASPTLYRIGFNSSGTMKNTHDSNSLALASTLVATQCSPFTEIFHSNANPSLSTDLLFFSVEAGCVATGGGTGGCLMSFDITAGFPTAATQARPEPGGTSAIVVDNVSTQPQASSIYFTTLSNSTCGDGGSGTGCAIKLTQSGLN